MPSHFAITDRRLDTIWPRITVFWEELIGKYESGKYLEEVYLNGVAQFASPQTVSTAQLRRLLLWKYRKSPRRKISPRLAPTIRTAIRAWPIYIECLPASASLAKDFWDKQFGARSFVTRCFLAHLAFPNSIPIIDVHTWRALTYLHGKMGNVDQLRINPREWRHAAQLHELMVAIRDRKGNGTTLRDVDKVLMMLGKHLAPRIRPLPNVAAAKRRGPRTAPKRRR